MPGFCCGSQVGPDYTQELLESAGVLRFPWRDEEALLQHYVGTDAELWLKMASKVVRFFETESQ